MQHLDDGTIHAWLDGALGAADAAAVEAHAAACRACADRVAEARGLIAASSRILASLDDVPAGVVPIERPAAVAAAGVASPAFAAMAPVATPDAAVPRARWGHRYGRIAAVLAFVAAGTLVLTREANRRDLFVAERTATLVDSAHLRRDVAPRAPNTTTVPRPEPAPAPAQRRAAAPPPAALGGAAHQPAPAAPPHAKPLAVAPRQNAASALEAPSAARLRQFGDVSKTTDTTVAMQAQKAALAAKLEPTSLAGVPGGSTFSSVRGRPALRLVSVDSVQRGTVMVRRETYAIGGSQQVVLETTPAGGVPNDLLSDSISPSPAANAPAARADSSAEAIHVIRWRGADGTGYTLSGPVSIDELQQIRATLGKG
ncbi:MAG TPA: zf-HC2 domain-containing protein [Gemmatimonadaceae bacterium]